MLEQSFFLMPFQHSEELATQIESDASGSRDAAKVRLLATAMRDLAGVQ